MRSACAEYLRGEFGVHAAKLGAIVTRLIEYADEVHDNIHRRRQLIERRLVMDVGGDKADSW